MQRLLTALAFAAGLFGTLSAPLPAAAQGNPFAPVITVNGRPITGFELEQRLRFLTIIGAQGDLPALAEQALIEDRVRLDEAERQGIEPTAEQVMAGMTEFAGRANLTPEQFVEAVGQAGVEAETFRDFVRAGLVWREVVRARFEGRVTVSDAEIDRALSVTVDRGAGPRVLVSEIIIPGDGARISASRRKAERLAEALAEGASFASLAEANSAAPSRLDGGALGWMPLTNLPGNVRAALLQLGEGQVTPPLPVPGGVGLFQLRGLEEGGEIQPSRIMVDYAAFYLPGGRTEATLAEAARIRGRVDTCDDLYKVARGLPADQLRREEVPLNALPGDFAREIAAMDEGESSTALTSGNALVFLMLCSRKAVLADGGVPTEEEIAAANDLRIVNPAAPGAQGDEPPPRIDDELGFGAGPSREAVRVELVNQRLNQLSDGLLAELVADAVIVRK